MSELIKALERMMKETLEDMRKFDAKLQELLDSRNTIDSQLQMYSNAKTKMEGAKQILDELEEFYA